VRVDLHGDGDAGMAEDLGDGHQRRAGVEQRTFCLTPLVAHATLTVLPNVHRKGHDMDDLVQRLASGDHPVTVGGPQPTVEDFKHHLEDMGYVFIKFTGTRAGTDLGVRVDKAASDLSRADFEQSTGTAHVEGTLSLNYVNVRCVADIDLATLNGTGHLVILGEVSP
jgi:hypothetical protein